MKKALLFLLCIVAGISAVNADKCPEKYEYVYQNGERCCFHNSEPNFGELTLDSTSCFDDDSIACPTGICSGGHRSAKIQNTGKDCWYKCNSKQGPCSWCGSAGMCCKKGFNDKSNGCDGTFGGSTRHECVLRCEDDRKCEGYKSYCYKTGTGHEQFMIDHCSKTCGFCDPDQDYTLLYKVYNQINEWRANVGVPAVRRDLELEKIVQSAGFIMSHDQHKKQSRLADAMADRKCGWKYGKTQSDIIACGCEDDAERCPQIGCLGKGSGFANFELEKPAKNWIVHKDTKPHYSRTISSQNTIIGCSVIKKWIEGEYGGPQWGYSIWCTLMGPFDVTDWNDEVVEQPKCY